MSGQPYRYYTDPTKYRTMFMDTLELQANINAMNLEANKTYRETGQLPAVSQMKDSRTTSEILADSLKLKIDITQAIAKISSQQFGQIVVQRIESSPLNIDNKLLIFTAQRIDDIVENLKKIYKYGISGDSNDAEQLIKFIVKMYNDKNSITAQTKSFMDSQGLRTFTQSSNVFLSLFQFLSSLSVKIITMNKNIARIEDYLSSVEDEDTTGPIKLILPLRSAQVITAQIASLLKTIMEVLPANQQEATFLEQIIIMYTEQSSSITPTPMRRGQLAVPPEDMFLDSESDTGSKVLNDDLFDELTEYLDYINTGLPSTGIITTLMSQLETFYKQFLSSYEVNVSSVLKDDPRLYYPSIVKSGIENAILINIKKVVDTGNNLYGVLLPSVEWTEYRIKQLKNVKIRLYNRVKNMRERTNTTTQQAQEQAPAQAPIIEEPDSEVIPPLPNKKYSDELNETADELNNFYNNSDTDFFDTDRIDEIFSQIDNEFGKNFSLPEGSDRNDYLINIESAINFLNNMAREARARGEGFAGKVPKRRGRPKGSGIGKTKTYKEIVKANSAPDKGIFETPRFVKFGKYLVNTHRLNNEDIFALKRPSGGNIVEIPSIKVSKNLSSVIKKMIGGEIPTYSDISKLSEPEKAYLHKVAKKSNILDKFDIPAPSKDALEKDIHQFEVMKGEILAGNDSKELIQKFKAHILKLSKNGTLPKREVQEILQDLLELNI